MTATGKSLRKKDVLVLLFAMGFPSLAAWLYFVKFAGSTVVQALYPLGKLIQFPLPVVWVRWGQSGTIRLRPTSARGVFSGSLLGLAIATGLLGLYFGYFKGSVYLEVMPEKLGAKITDFGLTEPWKYVAFGVLISVLHSALEEYYWRWFVFGQLRRSLPLWLAAALSGLAFMAHHIIIIDSYMRPEHFWTATMFFSLSIAMGGILWAWLYERTRSLVGPWLSHLLVDAGVWIVGYDQVFGLS